MQHPHSLSILSPLSAREVQTTAHGFMYIPRPHPNLMIDDGCQEGNGFRLAKANERANWETRRVCWLVCLPFGHSLRPRGFPAIVYLAPCNRKRTLGSSLKSFMHVPDQVLRLRVILCNLRLPGKTHSLGLPWVGWGLIRVLSIKSTSSCVMCAFGRPPLQYLETL